MEIIELFKIINVPIERLKDHKFQFVSQHLFGTHSMIYVCENCKLWAYTFFKKDYYEDQEFYIITDTTKKPNGWYNLVSLGPNAFNDPLNNKDLFLTCDETIIKNIIK